MLLLSFFFRFDFFIIFKLSVLTTGAASESIFIFGRVSFTVAGDAGCTTWADTGTVSSKATTIMAVKMKVGFMIVHLLVVILLVAGIRNLKNGFSYPFVFTKLPALRVASKRELADCIPGLAVFPINNQAQGKSSKKS